MTDSTRHTRAKSRTLSKRLRGELHSDSVAELEYIGQTVFGSSEKFMPRTAYKNLVSSREKICANPANLRLSHPSPEPRLTHQ